MLDQDKSGTSDLAEIDAGLRCNAAREACRILTRLRGRSLDWQPVTPVPKRGCAAGNGVPVASSASETIRQAANPGRGDISWNGCLS